MFLSYVDVSLPLFFPPSYLSKNKSIKLKNKQNKTMGQLSLLNPASLDFIDSHAASSSGPAFPTMPYSEVRKSAKPWGSFQSSANYLGHSTGQ